MRALIIGAGAVGQTYGLHLQRGGADVSFYVRPAYAEAARAGFTLYPLSGPERRTRLEGAGVLTSADEVAAQPWDQVWLAVSSPALRGDWLAEVLDAAGPEATVVLLTPGLDPSALLQRLVGDERLVRGMISLIAYQAPLPGEERFEAPGLAFWFPPLAPSPFTGARASAVVAALTAGGQPAKEVRDLSLQAALGSATLMPILLALEAADWRWSVFRERDRLREASAGVHQAATIVCHTLERRRPLGLRLFGAHTLRPLLWAAPRLLPLDIEVYLAYHFVKVGEQTREHIARTIELGREADLPTDVLERLLAGVPEAPGDATQAAAEVLAARHP